MIKLLIGGSPCTHWSIAQHNGREKEAHGLGWELFKCYLAAKDKFQPDYFLYENNKSAAEAIKEQISEELGAPLHYINSALVSAQNRKRFYCHNFGDIGQPEDRGIYVKDILDDNDGEILYKLEHVSKAQCVAIRGRYKPDGSIGQHLEPRDDGKTNTLTTVQKDNYIAQTIRLGDIQTTAQSHRVYSPYGKSVNLTANGGGVQALRQGFICAR
ncbi:DNA (cytosine-5)-methyltransferase 3A [Fusobacterium naviforme]|nr:DNA (cytosine-5)-methyltransferase 3A [Fusobacterium naviforme]STO27571.1 C-5 cytosine-specific DNA methylase [Fusobacterium naviforme]